MSDYMWMMYLHSEDMVLLEPFISLNKRIEMVVLKAREYNPRRMRQGSKVYTF